jgi:thymidylate synthase ThyX
MLYLMSIPIFLVIISMSSHALKEIQDLARAMYGVIPEEHKFLFEDKVET